MEYPFGAVIERLDGTFSVTPRMPLGRLDADALAAVADIVRRFGLPGVQASTAQRISIEGIPAESVEEIVNTLNGVGNRCPQSITACRGRGGCRRGVQDTQAMAEKVEGLLMDLGQMPAHLKVGLSGCPRCCGASYVKDIGLVGTPVGWTLVFGGNAGRKVRCGDEIRGNLLQDEVMAALKAVLSFYRENAKKGERTARFAERLGVVAIKNSSLGTLL